MKRIGLVASREFVTTIGNKGFLFGLLFLPLLIAAGIFLIPRILGASSPQVRGDVAIVDPTGDVAARLRTALAADVIAARRAENARRTLSAAVDGGAPRAAEDAAVARAVGQVPALTLLERPATSDVQDEKAWLLPKTEEERHLALIVVHKDAVVRDGTNDYGGYDIFVSSTLDEATENAVHESMREALVDARIAASRLDRAAVDAAMRVARPASVIVGADGEQRTQRGLTRALPFAMGLLIFMGVMMGGQSLMMSTIEEKSSRVVEVLLAAVSPFELMAGKLLGQLGVGLLVIGVYVGLGIMGLMQFAMFGLIHPMLVIYLFVFFLISYLVFGALMMAIGAAVNQVADAQSMMGPVMLLLVLPYVLSPMIGRAPNSTFSVVLSFLPPVNTIAMMARLASDAPPPAWQVWATVGVGLAAAVAAVWFAAKIFKVGLLMHGKPPNFATLLRWARAA